MRISVLLAAGAILLAGCGALKKKGEDAGSSSAAQDSGESTTASGDDSGGGATATTEDAGSGGTTATESLAANENDVSRFPDETKLDNVSKPIQNPAFGHARQSPPTGLEVATLKKGASVTQIAQKDKYFLSIFDDPKDATKKLMGWIYQDAFSPPKDAGPPQNTNLSCPAPQVLLITDVAFCGVVCKDDKGCPAGNVCHGSANRLVKGKGMEAVSTCVPAPKPPPVVKDAGAPKPADAGTAVVDAGVAPPPAADAGAAKLGIEIAPTGGKCPPTHLLVPKDGKCHAICAEGVSSAAICGSARCTKKCALAQPVCVSNTALCQ